MGTLITVLIVFAAVLLTLLVLVQNSKGGGLASGFAGGNQVMGAPKTADFLEKATWTLVAAIAFLSIISVGFTKGAEAKKAEAAQAVQYQAPTAPAQNDAAPAATTEAPATNEE